MTIRVRARKTSSERSPEAHNTRRSSMKSRRKSESPLAKRLSEAEDAIRRGDGEAVLELAIRSLERSAAALAESIAERRRTLKDMAKVEKHIDQTQAETARILKRLVNGVSRI